MCFCFVKPIIILIERKIIAPSRFVSMDRPPPTCGDCSVPFDRAKRLPRILPCGHTVCLQCVVAQVCAAEAHIEKDEEPGHVNHSTSGGGKCSECGRRFSLTPDCRGVPDVTELQINFALLAFVGTPAADDADEDGDADQPRARALGEPVGHAR